jgi:hypothetical protein
MMQDINLPCSNKTNHYAAIMVPFLRLLARLTLTQLHFTKIPLVDWLLTTYDTS